MEANGILKIEKRPISYWLICWIVALPLLWGTFFDLLALPAFVKYTADIAWFMLLCLMAFRRNIVVQKKIYLLVITVVTFFVYCLITYLINYQSIGYFFWGTRNNFRFYVLFFAVVTFLREKDAQTIYKILDIVFWINIITILIQYFVFHYEQDRLGGIFGVEIGVNASTVIFLTIIISRSLISYMDKKENFYLCALKCIAALFVAALAEIKFFFVFFIIILVMAALLTAFSWRKLLIFIVGAVFVAITSALLVTLFDFDDFLSLKNIWESATKDHYSTTQTVNRLSAIPTLARTIVPDFVDRLFGFGLGNCDTSSFAIFNTPFYQAYGYLRYNYFSAAFLFLEVGFVGIIMYVAFFGLCFVLTLKRIREGLCNALHGKIALIMAVLAVVLVVYNSSLRAEAGYMVYFVLALPFLNLQGKTEI